MEKAKAPGLKWRKLASGPSPVWVADEEDVRRGYRPKTVNLRHIADDPLMIVAKCNALQADMLLWRAGYRHDPLAFDGTVKALLSLYQRHPESPFHSLKPSSRRTYLGFLAKLEGHIGDLNVESVSGVDIVRWHRTWSMDGKYLAAAAMARAVLEAALRFGVMLRLPGCADLLSIARETRRSLPRPAARTASMSPEQVTAARAAAHAAGSPARALAYAVAFETTLRLWDVIGQWWPIDEGGISDVIDPGSGLKWFGLKWEDVDRNQTLRLTPSKTSGTTGRAIVYPLSKAPMVIEELAHWPENDRRGPMIVNEATGLPYRTNAFAHGWRIDRKAASIPSSVWARDLRASGITEGRASEATADDAAKVAGHSGKATTSRVYDRAVLEAADRFADARIRGRERSGNAGGNER